MKRLLKRFIAAVVVVAMLMPYLVLDGFAISAGTTKYGVANVDCYSKVSYDEETNTFALDLEISAELYDHYENDDDETADRGYFSANYTGWYLVELWGGNGANGLVAESGSEAGVGGKGGYVYAKMYLEEGDILFYSLGGNGQSTYVSGEGGGGNGGGHGGTKVTYGVGGGGGYSALFLFDDAAYFQKNYLNANNEFVGENISDYDRLTKYVMIAGGGGGGGSPIKGSAQFTPDGGAGGTIGQSAIVGEIQGIGATVAGTYYSGDNGKSSDTSTKYVGQGGREKPGDVAGTAWNWMSGELPNDWSGSYNAERPGGAGGAGNLRGGGGGGGYSGGSGGIQQSIISPSNIGGGGGGSSFIATRVNEQDTTTTLSDEEKNLLDSSDPKMQPKSGAVSITYLPDEDTIQFSHLPHTSVSFTISPYFRATGFSYTQVVTGTATDSETGETYTTYNFAYETQPDGSVNVTIQNISLVPTQTNLSGSLGISLKLTPQSVFPGGNDVPLLKDGKITLKSNVNETTGEITMDPDSYHVNVPLNFTAVSRSHIGHQSITLSPSDMYHDTYADIRNNLSGNDMYRFIESISPYTVEGMTGETTLTASTSFSVGFTVVPKNNSSINPIVGPENETTTFTATAEVTVLALHEGHLNGQKLEFSKELTYNENNNTYTYTLTTEADNSRSAHIPDPDSLFGPGTLEYPVPHDGYYLIQAWGGDGAKGETGSGYNTFEGGSGAAGGYTYGYLLLTAGDLIKVEKVGFRGDPANDSGKVGGGGGSYTVVTVTYGATKKTEIVAIAGGGGGGGNGIAGSWIGALGARGESAKREEFIRTELQLKDGVLDEAAYTGAAGKVGTSNNLFSYSGGAAGASGQNFFHEKGSREYDNTKLTHLTPEEFKAAIIGETNPNTNEDYNKDKTVIGDGAAYISCLELTNHTHVTTDLSHYTIDIPFSKYFTVDRDSVVGVNNWKELTNDGDKTLAFDGVTLSDNVLTILNIRPYQDGGEEEGVYESHIDFSISVTLTPEEGFLGGNNVPVTVPILQPTHTPENGETPATEDNSEPEEPSVREAVGWISQAGSSAEVSLIEKADYANVKLGEVSIGTLEGHELNFIANAKETYSRQQLYTWSNPWTKPIEGDAWKADFLETVDLLTLEGSTEDVGPGPWAVPSLNTYYDVTVGIRSGTQYAEVGPKVEPQLLTAKAAVLVQFRLNFDVSGLDTDPVPDAEKGVDLDAGADYEVILTPQKGYALPGNVTLQYASGGDVPFGYNSATGSIVIPKSSITDSMTLTAAGSKITYHIYYAYEQTPDSAEETVYTQDYHYGDTVSAWEYMGDNITGHTFGWRWLTHPDSDGVDAYGDSLDGKKMPANDIWVIGTYTPKEYTLRVEYQWSAEVDTNNANLPALTAPVEQTYRFGESYYIETPRIQGYAADFAVVNGTIDAALIATATERDGQPPLILRTVTYEPSDNQLRINYHYTDTGVIEVHRETVATDAQYSVTVPQVEGYEADRTNVSGTMVAGGVEVTVTYTPKSYQVNLMVPQPGGEASLLTSRHVYYNSIYGYTKNVQGAKVFESLPEQVHLAGSKFLGWYIQNGNEKSWVTNETKFDLSHLSGNTVTLYAAFEKESYLVTVEHVYLNGTAAAPEESEEVNFGDSFACTAKSLTGYTAYILGSEADKDTQGVVQIGNTYYVPASSIVIDPMPAQPVDRAFIYIGNYYTLTIHYKYGETNQPVGDKAPDRTVQVRYGDSWEPVPSPVIENMTCTIPVVSGVMDSISGKVFTVYYYTVAPEISVTVTWGDLVYTHNRGTWDPETHQYKNGTFSSVDDANKIEIQNGSTIPIDATLTFTNNPAYTDIHGYFTRTNSAKGEAVSVVRVDKGDPDPIENVWLWLGGSLPDTVSGSMVIGGQCTVSIAGGG